MTLVPSKGGAGGATDKIAKNDSRIDGTMWVVVVQGTGRHQYVLQVPAGCCASWPWALVRTGVAASSLGQAWGLLDASFASQLGHCISSTGRIWAVCQLLCVWWQRWVMRGGWL